MNAKETHIRTYMYMYMKRLADVQRIS